jgi:hypothetical protein
MVSQPAANKQHTEKEVHICGNAPVGDVVSDHTSLKWLKDDWHSISFVSSSYSIKWISFASLLLLLPTRK